MMVAVPATSSDVPNLSMARPSSSTAVNASDPATGYRLRGRHHDRPPRKKKTNHEGGASPAGDHRADAGLCRQFLQRQQCGHRHPDQKLVRTIKVGRPSRRSSRAGLRMTSESPDRKALTSPSGSDCHCGDHLDRDSDRQDGDNTDPSVLATSRRLIFPTSIVSRTAHRPRIVADDKGLGCPRLRIVPIAHGVSAYNTHHETGVGQYHFRWPRPGTTLRANSRRKSSANHHWTAKHIHVATSRSIHRPPVAVPPVQYGENRR